MKFILVEKTKKDKFLSIFQLLKHSTQTIHFYFNEDRVYIQGMNSGHSCLFELFLEYEWFDYFEKENISLIVDINIFISILSIASDNQFLMIEFEKEKEDKLNISYIQNKEIITYLPQYKFQESSHYNKFFEITLMELEEDLLSIPELEYDAEMAICPKIWSEVLSQLALFADKINIKCNEEMIELKSLGEQGEMKIDIPIDNIQEYSINEGEEMDMLFNIQLLSKLSLTTKLTNSVNISFKKDFPLQIKYPFDKNILVFYVAFMVDND